jgi:hypothetical protein
MRRGSDIDDANDIMIASQGSMGWNRVSAADPRMFASSPLSVRLQRIAELIRRAEQSMARASALV